jgi:hypothetical protein
MRRLRNFLAIAVLCAGLFGCGTPGAPRPPSLRLPETVHDLVATRQGSTVTFRWTEPARTTDGENIRELGTTQVCMGINDFPMTHCDQVVADLSQDPYVQCKPKVGQPAQCQVALATEIQQQFPLGESTYAIEVQNPSGRSAGLSNQVRIPTAPTAAPPTNVRVETTPDGVVITGYREEPPPLPSRISLTDHVYRRDENSTATIDLGTALSFQSGKNVYPKFTDKNAEWEKTYFYSLGVNTTVSLPDGSIVDVKGDPSPEVKLFVHDVFAPAAATGLQAVASGVGQQPFVDMTWAPNTESDLAGYNVYRHEEGQPAMKINGGLLASPSYRDANVQRGHKYFYAASAVDLRGNEGQKSPEASEVVH